MLVKSGGVRALWSTVRAYSSADILAKDAQGEHKKHRHFLHCITISDDILFLFFPVVMYRRSWYHSGSYLQSCQS
jgi:hypothetical protein